MSLFKSVLNIFFTILTVIEFSLPAFLFMNPIKIIEDVPSLLLVSSGLLLLHPLLYILTFRKFNIKGVYLSTIFGLRKNGLIYYLLLSLFAGFYLVFQKDCDEYGREYCAKHSTPKKIGLNMALLFAGVFGFIFSNEMYKHILYKYEKYENYQYSKSVLDYVNKQQRRLRRRKKRMKKRMKKKMKKKSN